ncbi:MAG: hypothetical protein P4L84_33085 [Isosphaeraceae bacterium]|nr:hypothetical protein [Isosphaeraceae bacterium]
MSIEVECACGKRTTVSNELAGKRGRCRSCGEVVTIPSPATPDQIGEWLAVGAGPAIDRPVYPAVPVPQPPALAIELDPADVDTRIAPDVRRARPTDGRSRLVLIAAVVATVLFIAGAVVVVFHGRGKEPADEAGGSSAREASAPAPSLDAEEVLKSYLVQKTVEGRRPFVWHPDKAIPLMRADDMGEEVALPPHKIVKRVDVPADADYPLPYSMFQVHFDDTYPDSVYHLVRTPEGYRIDWPSLRGRDMPLPTFLAERSTTPVKFRLYCTLDNYYNYEYGDSQATHYSISLSDSAGRTIHGYLRRDRPEAKRFVGMIAPGRDVMALVELRQVGPGRLPLGRDNEHLEIVRVVSFCWIDWNE